MRNRLFSCLFAVLLALLTLPQSPLLAQVNNPPSPSASFVQGPDPTGNAGYPFSVTPATGTSAFPVSGTFWQSVQPVSQSGAWTLGQGAPNTLANAWPFVITDLFNILGTSSNPLRIDPTGTTTQPVSGSVSVSNFPATQPVSGTVTANAGTGTFTVGGTVTANAGTGTFTVGGTVTGNQGTGQTAANAWPFYLTDLTNLLGTSGHPVRTDPTGTTTQPVSGSVSVSNFPATQPVSGTVTSNQGTANTASNSWPVLVTDGTNTLGTSGHPIRTDPTGTTTQPVSGTVTANAGTGTFTVGGTVTANQGGAPWSVSQSGNWTSRVVGNAGATIDSTVGAGTAPTNQVVVGSVYNSSAPAPTNGQAMALQADQAGNLRFTPGAASLALSAWNSSTALNATQTIFTNSGVPAVEVQITQTTTLTAGAVTFEVTYDGSNWVTIPADCVVDPMSTMQVTIALPYTVQASTNKQFLLFTRGAQGLRVKLSTQISGTGTVTPNYNLLARPSLQQIFGPVTANAGTGNFNVIGTLTNNNAAPGANNVGVLPVIANASVPTFTEGDQTLLSVDLSGRLRTVDPAPSEAVSGYTTSDIVNTTSTQVVAGSASKNLYITSIVVTNMSGSVDTRVDLQDGSGGTAIYGGFAAHGGGGFSISIPFPGLKVPTSGNGLYTVCGTTGAQVRVSAAGIAR